MSWCRNLLSFWWYHERLTMRQWPTVFWYFIASNSFQLFVCNKVRKEYTRTSLEWTLTGQKLHFQIICSQSFAVVTYKTEPGLNGNLPLTEHFSFILGYRLETNVKLPLINKKYGNEKIWIWKTAVRFYTCLPFVKLSHILLRETYKIRSISD